VFLILLGNLLLPFIHGQETATLNYQGRVAVRGVAFSGNGQFKFALIRPEFDISGTANATAVVNGGFLTGVSLNSGGSGYAFPPTVTITGGGGSGASATASIDGGSVTAITIDNPGSGYTGAPDVAVSPPYDSWVTEWSNDGTSIGGSEPSDAIELSVEDGLFSLRLGETSIPNMAAISRSALLDEKLRLRVWFNDGQNSSQLLGDTPLSMAAHAVHANPKQRQYTDLPFQIFAAGGSARAGSDGNTWPSDSYGRLFVLPFSLDPPGSSDNSSFEMRYPVPDRAITFQSVAASLEGLGSSTTATLSLIRLDQNANSEVVASVAVTFGTVISNKFLELPLAQPLDWDSYQYLIQINLVADRYLAGAINKYDQFLKVKSCKVSYTGAAR
jgi:hypothetical protein